jgi:hypothetical protein
MVTWIFSLLVFLAPPEHRAALPAYPGWQETAGQRAARYQSIAEDIAAVATDPREHALLVAVAYHESGFAPDVDLGPCYRGPRNDSPRCDGGLAASMWQIRASHEERQELFADRRRAAARALGAMRRSAKHCALKHGREAGLRAYASGSCERGVEESRVMVRLTLRLLAVRPPPAK